MKNNNMFQRVFGKSIVIVTAANLLFGMYAYVGYGDCSVSGGDCIQGNVISNLSPGVVTTTVKVMLCLDLLFTCVVFLFPFSEVMERLLLDVK